MDTIERDFLHGASPAHSIIFNNDVLTKTKGITANDLYTYVTLCWFAQTHGDISLSALLEHSKEKQKDLKPWQIEKSFKRLEKLGIKPVTKEEAEKIWRSRFEVVE